MGKSSGARPKKAVAEEVAVLRELLNKLTSSEWQRAYAVFDKIAELCGHLGPMGGGSHPRSCRYCGYYGHTKEFCERRKRAVEWEDERRLKVMRTESEAMRMEVQQARKADPAWAAELRDLDARYRRAMDEGGCEGCLREGDWPCGECEQCARFDYWFNLPIGSQKIGP